MLSSTVFGAAWTWLWETAPLQAFNELLLVPLVTASIDTND